MNLKIINYIVNEVHFKANPLPQGVTNFTIKPNIRMDIKKEARTLSLSITVTVKGSETEPVPFDLDVRLTGNFAILSPAASVDELRIEASKTLYPYMRAYVATYRNENRSGSGGFRKSRKTRRGRHNDTSRRRGGLSP